MSEDSGWERVVHAGYRYAWLAVWGAIATGLTGVVICLFYFLGAVGPMTTYWPAYVAWIPRSAFLFLAMAGIIYIATKLVVAGLYTPWAPTLDERFKKWGRRLVRIGTFAAWALLAIEILMTVYSADMMGRGGTAGALPLVNSLYGLVRAFLGFLGLMTAVLVMKSLLIISESGETQLRAEEAHHEQ